MQIHTYEHVYEKNRLLVIATLFADRNEVRETIIACSVSIMLIYGVFLPIHKLYKWWISAEPASGVTSALRIPQPGSEYITVILEE